MYTIGRFSGIGRISTKTLRYYDEIGLLKPVYVDKVSQYRYYSDKQIYEVMMISELKEYGLKLEEIKAIKDSNDAALLINFLKRKAHEIEREIQTNIELQRHINDKLQKIELGGNIVEVNTNLHVEIKDRETLIVAYRRATICIDNIGNIIGKVFEDIAKMNLQPAGPVITVHYDKEFDADNVDLEVCVPVNKEAVTESDASLKAFKGGSHASIIFVGPYSRIGEAYIKITKWIEDNKYQIVGAPFEVYLSGPGSVKNQNEFVTELCFPIAK